MARRMFVGGYNVRTAGHSAHFADLWDIRA